MADPGQMAQLAQLLAQTTGANTQAMQAATQQLRAAESQPGFGLVLLELLRGSNIDAASRQAGAIYFKNYVRRLWSLEVGGIQAADRQAIKQHLLSLMLQAPKAIQVQLAAGLEEIALTDYPDQWQSLLPEIVQHLKTSQDMGVLKGTMEIANTVFLKFRSQARSNELLRDVKYTVLGFQETHLAVFKAAAERVLGGSVPAEQLAAHMDLLIATVGAFYSCNVVDLPEFFEDHREDYFKVFLELLKFNHAAVLGQGDQQGPLERLKGEICRCFALYTDKYQEEFMPFLLPCVNAVWSLLTSLSQQELNDQLVAAGIHFLSSAAATQWPQSPFEDPTVLAGICEKIVFPNILLRDTDVELFEDNPLEYVRRDMEAADQDTRRRSSMDLVKAMGKFSEEKVTAILIGYVKELMAQAGQQAERSERFKDACIYLCIAMAVRGQTQREGVTVVNQNINVLDFFSGIVAPQLGAQPIDQHPILRASCLKFVTVFRNQLPRDIISSIFPAICAHVQAQSPVVHTYAAICVEKLVSVRDRSSLQGPSTLRYDPAALKQPLLQMVDPILRIIAQGKGIPNNEYLMRGVARIFAFLRQQCGEAGLGTLRPLAQIVMAMAENPSNPVFNHNLFEAIASIVKVCVPTQPDAVEGVLLPVLGTVLERNVADFLPYTFQILGLLLDAAPNVKPLYQELFARLLTLDLWKAQANVPGLVRLLKAYFCKHALFAQLLGGQIQAVFERFQLILCNKKTESSAFELLNAVYMHLPFELYQSYFKTLVTVLLSRLQNSKSPKFQKEFVVSMSLFSHRSPVGTLPSVLNEIQPGLIGGLLTGMWLPALKMALKLDERKVCATGLAKLMACDDVRQNAPVLSACCAALVSLLGLTPSTSVPQGLVEEASDDEPAPPDGGAGLEFEVAFSKLRNTDLPGAAAGLAPDVPDLPSAARALLAPHRATVQQLAQADGQFAPLAAFLQ